MSGLQRLRREALPGGRPALAVLGPGALAALPRGLRGARRVLLVTGCEAFRSSGAERAIRPALEGLELVRGAGVPSSTPLASVEELLALARAQSPDLVLGVGGGSALDAAKIIAALAPTSMRVEEALAAGRSLGTGLPMIAIPTTAGSGAEASSGAVVWRGPIKHGLDGPGVRPVLALVDPALSASMSPALAATTGLDALCQSIESCWSAAASPRSRALARRALGLILPALVPAVVQRDPAAHERMARAAFFAGCAIDLTRTTAPHAVSYALTARWGVPHGHAVSLTLGAFFEYNAGVGEQDNNHPGGPRAVRAAMRPLLRLLEVTDAQDWARRFEQLLRQLGLAARLREVGVQWADLELLAGSANPGRLANNPRRLDQSALRSVLERAW